MEYGGRFLFDDFELRADSGELFRYGVPVKLQPQPARVLELLALHAGEVVTREELRRHLWGEDTFVDFEHGLNFSIRQLRRTLGDSAEVPRFVETVPRRGYRFLVPVRFEAAPLPRDRPAGRSFRAVKAVTLLALLSCLSGPQPPQPPRNSPTLPGVPAAARQAYFEGRYLTRPEASPAEVEKGVAAFQRASLLAPRFAPAFTGLARAEMRVGKHPAEKFPVAEAAARRAISIDPRQAEAHLVLAQVFIRELDVVRAGQEIDLALAAKPALADAQALRADYLAVLGRHDEALAAAERSRELDPESKVTSPDLLCYHFLLARRWDEAILCGERIVALLPAADYDARFARIWVLYAAWRKGDLGKALATARVLAASFEGTFPVPRRLRNLRDFWEWDLARLGAYARQSPLSPARLALDYAALGERDRALALLEQSIQQRDSWFLLFLGADPRVDPLRGDPRFEKLLRRIGIEDQVRPKLPPTVLDSLAAAASSPGPPPAGRGASASPAAPGDS
ncbi:MAG TPA: winged helix-turn-helix domain-containing protein [Thermoanaerobaculia bacterium]|nr:winged helix-turn-helix domain-containing protein [Thermoanaerobaculia bacterium]